MEGGSAGAGIFDPDFSAGGFDDFFDDGEADAGAFGIGLETLEDVEDFIVIFFGNAGAFIGHDDLDSILGIFDFDMDYGVGAIAGVFEGVDEEVVDDLSEAFGVGHDDGEIFGDLDGDDHFAEAFPVFIEESTDHLIQVDWLGLVDDATDAAEFEEDLNGVMQTKGGFLDMFEVSGHGVGAAGGEAALEMDEESLDGDEG